MSLALRTRRRVAALVAVLAVAALLAVLLASASGGGGVPAVSDHAPGGIDRVIRNAPLLIAPAAGTGIMAPV